MTSLQPTTVLVTPIYIDPNEFDRRLRAAHPDEDAILQLARDLRTGRIIVTDADEPYAKRLAEFVTMATGLPTSARIRNSN